MAAPDTPFARFGRVRAQPRASERLSIDPGEHDVLAHLHMRLKPGAQAAAESRHALDRLDDSLTPDQLDELRLLVTELVTNSVRHGTPQHGWITLEVEVYANGVRVVVTDRGPGFELTGKPRPHVDRPGGWGLCLVDGLADRWGVERGDQTAVWFELDRGRSRFADAV